MKKVDLHYPAGKCFVLDEGDFRLITVSWNPNFFSYYGDKIEKNIGNTDASTKHFPSS